MTASHEPIYVRRERSGDEAAIAHVNDAAFGGCDESRIVEAVRKSGRATASLVAVDRDRIVGHVLFTPVELESAGPRLMACGLGPLAVLPELQRRGIGSRLVDVGLRECALAGCHLVIVVGHPAYYPRFGFRPARPYGLTCEFAVPDEVFMVAELIPGALTGRGGLVRYLPEFQSR